MSVETREKGFPSSEGASNATRKNSSVFSGIAAASAPWGVLVFVNDSMFTGFNQLHSKYLRLHFEPFGSILTTLSRAER